jgi:transposase
LHIRQKSYINGLFSAAPEAPMPFAPAPPPFPPLPDAEVTLLAANLPPPEGRPGRPPQDRRRTLDAIFWIACSRGPWKDLPAHFGRADTASRALRRWAKSGHMDLLLHQAATATRRDRVWRALAWRIARAWRRISRVVALSQLMLAKRLELRAALPADPRWLPDPDLSKALQREIATALHHIEDQQPGVFATFARLLGRAAGNMRYWRLR